MVYLWYVYYVPSLSFCLFSTEFFIKRNPKRAIIEYEMLKKIVYALFPLFIFAFVFLKRGTMRRDSTTADKCFDNSD